MEAATKGSVMLACVAYSDALCDRVGQPRVRERFSPELKAALATTTRTTWHPQPLLVEVLRAIVSVHHDPVRSYADLVECGRAISAYGVNTFLKLILKIMTPRLFVLKLDELWARGTRGGIMSVDASAIDQKRLTCTLSDIAGFDHIGPTGCGILGFALEKITGVPVEITATPWSFEEPGPAAVRWDISW